MKNSNGKLLVGIFLLLIGSAFFLRNLDVLPWEFEYIYLGWPTWIFIIGLLITISSRGNFGGISLMIIGAVFFAARFYHYPTDKILSDIWPLFLILFGLSIMFKHRKNNNSNGKNIDSIEYKDDTLDLTSIFSENKRRIVSQNFKKAKVTTLFGATELDFRDAKPAQNCIIECDTIFGGIDIIIPSSWKVRNHTTAIFGGADDSRRKSAPVEDNQEYILTVNGFVLFGGLDIKS